MVWISAPPLGEVRGFLPGGVFGQIIAGPANKAVGFTAASVLFLLAIAVGASLFFDFSWLSVAERVGGFIEARLQRARLPPRPPSPAINSRRRRHSNPSRSPRLSI